MCKFLTLLHVTVDIFLATVDIWKVYLRKQTEIVSHTPCKSDPEQYYVENAVIADSAWRSEQSVRKGTFKRLLYLPRGTRYQKYPSYQNDNLGTSVRQGTVLSLKTENHPLSYRPLSFTCRLRIFMIKSTVKTAVKTTVKPTVKSLKDKLSNHR